MTAKFAGRFSLLQTSFLIWVALYSCEAVAESVFTPILGGKLAYLEAEVADMDESGTASVISPGFEYQLSTPRTDLSLNYRIDSIQYSGLDREDRNVPYMTLNSEFSHDSGGRWKSQIYGSIDQADSSVDGILSNRDEIFNDQTEELRIARARTSRRGQFGPQVQFLANLGVDTVDFEDSEDTRGADLGFSIDNYLSTNAFTWSGSLTREVVKSDDGNEDSEINTADVNLNYRLSYRWQVFTNLRQTDTDDDELDEDRTLVGVLWTPKPSTFLRLGTGKLGDSDIYELDAETRTRKVRFNASYTEEITTARRDTVDALNQGAFVGTVNPQSVSSRPVVQQRTDISAVVEGVRSDFTVNLYDYNRDDVVFTEEEEGTGFELIFSRRLPRESSLEIGLFGERYRLVQTNELLELGVKYRRQQSKYVELATGVLFSRQDSDVPENEYKQAQIILSAVAKF
ncbi:MAG: hypothetical protein PVF33_10910 [Candidatus Latescibacterota bacterium]|jgi:hypothetical protein